MESKPQKIIGLQHFSKADIEEKVEELLALWLPEYLEKSKIFAWERVCERLKTEHEVTITLDANLGTFDGHQILGALTLDPRQIFVEKTIFKEKNFTFVLAHEIGHLMLHRKLTFPQNWDGRFEDNQKSMSPINNQTKTDWEWLEWQANAFAGCLIMPRKTIIHGLYRCQKVIGQRQSHRILVKNDSQDIKAYEDLVTELAKWYFVSRTVVKIRLRELGICYGADYNSTHISNYM